jgi:hypothetical protein
MAVIGGEGVHDNNILQALLLLFISSGETVINQMQYADSQHG